MTNRYEICIVHPAKGVITFLSPGSERRIVKILDYMAQEGVQGSDYYDVFSHILEEGWEPFSVFEWAFMMRRIVPTRKPAPKSKKYSLKDEKG
jgi:hypothetical protein